MRDLEDAVRAFIEAGDGYWRRRSEAWAASLAIEVLASGRKAGIEPCREEVERLSTAAAKAQGLVFEAARSLPRAAQPAAERLKCRGRPEMAVAVLAFARHVGCDGHGTKPDLDCWRRLASSLEVELLGGEGVGDTSGGPPRIPLAVKKAWASYEWVCRVRPDLPDDNGNGQALGTLAQHDCIREHGCNAYPDGAPAFETWQRYLREYNRLTAGRKNTPRAGRAGRSIVRGDGSPSD